jgi:hypothetical protein
MVERKKEEEYYRYRSTMFSGTRSTDKLKV